MGKNKFSKETANAALTEIFNELTKRYLDTTDLPNPDVWGEESQLFRGEEEVAYKMVQISSETDDNIYLVSQLRYLIDKGEMELVILYDGLELLSEGISVDNINYTVSVMIECLETLYEIYKLKMVGII